LGRAKGTLRKAAKSEELKPRVVAVGDGTLEWWAGETGTPILSDIIFKY
jgi:hypothetical protein